MSRSLKFHLEKKDAVMSNPLTKEESRRVSTVTLIRINDMLDF